MKHFFLALVITIIHNMLIEANVQIFNGGNNVCYTEYVDCMHDIGNNNNDDHEATIEETNKDAVTITTVKNNTEIDMDEAYPKSQVDSTNDLETMISNDINNHLSDALLETCS